jgi:glutamate/tyrosine decarboxylase-like PLP-dependent enzyme
LNEDREKDRRWYHQFRDRPFRDFFLNIDLASKILLITAQLPTTAQLLATPYPHTSDIATTTMDPAESTGSVLPDITLIRRAEETLRRRVPTDGLGLDAVKKHLTNDVAPALNASSQSSRYYGFVTGGATPAAVFADNMVTEYDQNVQVHLPNESIATAVEASALDMVCDLVHLDRLDWTHRTFTTGATSANIIGLACAREHVISTAAARNGQFVGGTQPTVSSHGLSAAMAHAGISEIQILTTSPHSSLRKAASIVGLGHASVKDMGFYPTLPHRFDMNKLDEALQNSKAASIIAVSCSEVNSGLFATFGDEMLILRRLADKYGAWLHVDAAFGLLARILTPHGPWPHKPEYDFLSAGVQYIEYADSIAADAHKLFNVPYDCGIFLSRHLDIGTAVFQNPGKSTKQAQPAKVNARALLHCCSVSFFFSFAKSAC